MNIVAGRPQGNIYTADIRSRVGFNRTWRGEQDSHADDPFTAVSLDSQTFNYIAQELWNSNFYD